ncbi:MAG: lycopene cyclase family protein [Rubripirellula sp.]
MNINSETSEFDYLLVGGGLQSGLLALAIAHHHPDARVVLIERDQNLAGNHTWSFHPGDVPESCRRWIEPLIRYHWPGYQVRLGNFRRHVDLAYASIPSEHFARVVSRLFDTSAAVNEERFHGGAMWARQNASLGFHAGAAPAVAEMDSAWKETDSPWKLMTGTDVIHVSEDSVTTRCGQQIRGRLVIDCRGPAAQKARFSGSGFQKFHGFEIELEHDWPLESPVIMESCVDQEDGFRFIYTLPFTARRVLIEDTRFSDKPDCDRQDCFDLVQKYLQSNGVDRFKIIREESGVLPMPFSSELQPSSDSPLAGGYAGGWFHAATGYSFPMVVAFAEAVARGPLATARHRVSELSETHRRRSRYCRLLNRLLFRLVAPRHRHRIFRRFYRVLSEIAIERFYSHQFTAADAVRIVVGIPPTIIGLRPHRFIRSFLKGESP